MLPERLRAWLARYRLGRVFMLMFDMLEAHRAPTAAGAMAFDAFLSLVPLAAFAGYLLHLLREDYALVLRPLLNTAPEPVRQLVDAEFLRLSDAGATIVAPVSIAAFLWVSSAGISTAMGVFESMFHSPERPWYIRRLIAMGAVVASFIGLIVVVTVAVLVAKLWGSFGAALLAALVPPVVVIGLLCGFFRIAIRGPRPLRRRVLPGAVVTLVLWTATSAVFSLYVARLSRYATLYGSLAAAAIFMFWLWLLALILLVGGEVNAQLEGVREGEP
ncbi:MAG TPA: YhjD/YihY/BrkB family envelope integrity protein, partial [Minicystis sp.]|nr:YhjD/YihY/BrkB family envelope integrity protein [Minicystis sp.]